MRKSTASILAVVVLVVAVAGAGLWWFLRDDAPEEVDIDDAVAANTDTTEAGSDDGSTSSTAAAGSDAGIDGTWTVDANSGEVDFETATGSFAGFRVDEELARVGSTEAVGRTRDVSGTVTIADGQLTATDLTVDLSTVTTNESRRDDKVQSALDTSEFPTATFTLSEPVELPAGLAEGETVSTTATGELTIHGVNKEVEVTIDAVVKDGTGFVTGSTDFLLSDFGVTAPSAPMVLSVSDTATVEWQLLLTKGA